MRFSLYYLLPLTAPHRNKKKWPGHLHVRATARSLKNDYGNSSLTPKIGKATALTAMVLSSSTSPPRIISHHFAAGSRHTSRNSVLSGFCLHVGVQLSATKPWL